jgi:hypothetical protein
VGSSKWMKATGTSPTSLKINIDTPGDDLGTVFEVPYSSFVLSRWNLYSASVNRYLGAPYGGGYDGNFASTSVSSYETFPVTVLGTNTISMKVMDG